MERYGPKSGMTQEEEWMAVRLSHLAAIAAGQEQVTSDALHKAARSKEMPAHLAGLLQRGLKGDAGFAEPRTVYIEAKEPLKHLRKGTDRKTRTQQGKKSG